MTLENNQQPWQFITRNDIPIIIRWGNSITYVVTEKKYNSTTFVGNHKEE